MKILYILLGILCCVAASSTTDDDQKSTHTNNWAVLVSSSRFWFNYRHMANVLSFYRTVKRLGIPDSQIILMMSDDVACNPRNAFPGSVFNNKDRALDLYGDNIEVDYRGYEVTVENFIRLLTDRWGPDHPRSKRLLTDENSNIFIYLTGHGGEDFLKFQDAEEISSYDIADAFQQMAEKKRYNEIFFMIDTCQANTMYSKFYSPNILAVGSSRLDESSYSHHSDTELGVAVIDRFTYYNLEFLEQIEKDSNKTMADLFETYTFEDIHSHAGIRTDLYNRNLSKVLLTDFFGNIQKVEVGNLEEDLLYLAMTNEDGSPKQLSTQLSQQPQTNISSERKPRLLNKDSSKENYINLESTESSLGRRILIAILLVSTLGFTYTLK
ncbi:BA75_03040T0 [Komagataella pastoris]|uniref:BA75_03040T0 n=1 Tax=Komagataella pastoris TaxID=4922 RepID=A0A1B2JDH6_PICPA|nr:BA75_03040T0 [Komagataella pastoris]